MTYDLDKETPEFFEFIVGGNTYKMVYPTSEQIEEIRNLKNEKERGEKTLAFITPVTENAPDIEEALKKKNIKAYQKFYEMIETEMGVTD